MFEFLCMCRPRLSMAGGSWLGRVGSWRSALLHLHWGRDWWPPPWGVKWDPRLWGCGELRLLEWLNQACWCPELAQLSCLWLGLEVGHGGGWAPALARHSHSGLPHLHGLTLTFLLDTSRECTAASVLVLAALLSSLATLEHNVNFDTLHWGDLLLPAAHRQDIYGLLLNNLWLLKFSLKQPPGSRYHHLLFLSFAIIAWFCHLESFHCLWLSSFLQRNKWICSVPAPSALREQLPFRKTVLMPLTVLHVWD